MRYGLVAGPCSAESLEDLRLVACRLRSISAVCGKFEVWGLRAGAWKPRTRPGGFEGYGRSALAWLGAVRSEFSIPVCVEVGSARQVSAAYEYGLRDFWLGARTSGDPFAVDEIADALSHYDDLGRIYVKNPLSPDVGLWDGAFRRLERAGVGESHFVAVHRGFYPHGGARYRNAPRWDVALGFRADHPSVPFLCDPSHIAGRRGLVAPVAERALGYGFDGLFVEVHPDPRRALSDRSQQLSLGSFESFLDRLERFIGSLDAGGEDRGGLDRLRSQIDSVDEQLLELLSRRFEIVSEIGEWKRDHDRGIVSWSRRESHLRELVSYGESLGLDRGFILRLWDEVHAESLRYQEEVGSGGSFVIADAGCGYGCESSGDIGGLAE